MNIENSDNLIPTLISFPQMFYTQVIVQAPLAVDSFFFLRSGQQDSSEPSISLI